MKVLDVNWHMPNTKALALAALGLLGPGLVGCGSSPVKTNPGTDGGSLPAGTVCSVGQPITNLAVGGTQQDDDKNGTPANDPVKVVHLKDYQAGNKVLAILVAAEWCVPCQQEQAEVVASYKDYVAQNKGVAILEAITQNNDTTPATAATTSKWATHFGVPFDITFDADGALGPCSDPQTFPTQIVVRTSDMTVQWTHNGYEKGALETAINGVLANP